MTPEDDESDVIVWSDAGDLVDEYSKPNSVFYVHGIVNVNSPIAVALKCAVQEIVHSINPCLGEPQVDMKKEFYNARNALSKDPEAFASFSITSDSKVWKVLNDRLFRSDIGVLKTSLGPLVFATSLSELVRKHTLASTAVLDLVKWFMSPAAANGDPSPFEATKTEEEVAAADETAALRSRNARLQLQHRDGVDKAKQVEKELDAAKAIIAERAGIEAERDAAVAALAARDAGVEARLAEVNTLAENLAAEQRVTAEIGQRVDRLLAARSTVIESLAAFHQVGNKSKKAYADVVSQIERLLISDAAADTPQPQPMDNGDGEPSPGGGHKRGADEAGVSDEADAAAADAALVEPPEEDL